MCGKRISESGYLKIHMRERFFLCGKYMARAHRWDTIQMHKVWQEFAKNWLNDKYKRTIYGRGFGCRGALCNNAPPSYITVQYISRILQEVTPLNPTTFMYGEDPCYLHKWETIQVPPYKLNWKKHERTIASRGYLSVQSAARASQDQEALLRKLRKANQVHQIWWIISALVDLNSIIWEKEQTQ